MIRDDVPAGAEVEQAVKIDEFQAVNAQRGRRWHHGDLSQWSLLEWCGAMCGEAGEAANVAKKLRRLDLALPNKEQGLTNADAAPLREKLADEIGDTLIYGLIILSDLGFNASDVIERVFDRKSVEYGFPERARAVAPVQATEIERLREAMAQVRLGILKRDQFSAFEHELSILESALGAATGPQ